MDENSLISLSHINNSSFCSFYEKGADWINVHLYVREVDENDIIFEETRVVCKFTTRNTRFIKQHAGSKKGNYAFCYIINTREAIISSECSYTLKTPFIEIVLKKKIPQKWKSLHNLELTASAQADLNLDGKKRKNFDKKSQLLGGKSTPMKQPSEEKKQEVDIQMENSASSSSSKKSEDERNIKKAVQPQPEHTDGLTGLENYANNCYMNVVIQILANIQETRDYFKNDHYLKDINANNPLSSGGKVVKAFADVTKALWSLRKNAFKPAALKNIMGKRYSLFLGWQQHDAQEFFASLLDNLHEDLNESHYEKGGEKEKEKEKEKEGKEDSTVNEKTDTAWIAHLKRNNSFIVKLFHGQLMSKLTCAACHKVSHSFDPCAQISLPIVSTKHHLRILFFTRDVNKPPIMVPMQISTPNAKVWHLKNMLQTLVKVPPHLISLFTGISNVCYDVQSPLLSVRKYKYVVASEVSSKDEAEFISIPVFQYVLHPGQFVQCDNCFRSRASSSQQVNSAQQTNTTQQCESTKLKRCTRCFAVAYCSRECQTKHWQVHSKTCNKDLKMQVGVPFHIIIRKDLLTFETLEESLRDRAKFSVELFSTSSTEECNAGGSSDETREIDKQTQRLSLASSATCIIKLSNKPTNDESCVILNNDNFSPEHVFKSPYILVEWQNSPEESSGDASASVIRTKCVPNHELLDSDSNIGMTEEEEQCSIYDCLRLFMEPESLDERDSWKCPKCKSLQSAKKEMTISSPPRLLLLHLKRFTYGDFGQKINKSVTYPISNFDVSPFIAKETRCKIDHPLIYDLCGVINHSGSMRMGHYTCIVRMLGSHDQEEIGWRFFDDDTVRKIKSDRVVSPDAYVLVYRIRGAQQILKLESIFSENLVKRKHADAVAGATAALTVPNVEKVTKSDRYASQHLDSTKRTSSSESNYDEVCESANSGVHSGLKLKESFDSPAIQSSGACMPDAGVEALSMCSDVKKDADFVVGEAAYVPDVPQHGANNDSTSDGTTSDGITNNCATNDGLSNDDAPGLSNNCLNKDDVTNDGATIDGIPVATNDAVDHYCLFSGAETNDGATNVREINYCTINDATNDGEINDCANNGVTNNGEINDCANNGITIDGEMNDCANNGITIDGEINDCANNGITNNGEMNDCAINDGITNCAINDSAINDSAINDGVTNCAINDSAINDSAIDGVTSDGVAKDCAAGDGVASDGIANDGASNDIASDCVASGATIEGPTDDGINSDSPPNDDLANDSISTNRFDDIAENKMYGVASTDDTGSKEMKIVNDMEQLNISDDVGDVTCHFSPCEKDVADVNENDLD